MTARMTLELAEQTSVGPSADEVCLRFTSLAAQIFSSEIHADPVKEVIACVETWIFRYERQEDDPLARESRKLVGRNQDSKASEVALLRGSFGKKRPELWRIALTLHRDNVPRSSRSSFWL